MNRPIIPRSELSYKRMVQGNQRKYPLVIDDTAVLEWSGSGWVLLRPAQPEDRETLPAVAPPPSASRK